MDTAQPGSLVRFAFTSAIPPDLTQDALLQIAREAWRFNSANRITGWMTVSAGRFAQEMEGETSVLLPLLAKIISDPRHGRINVTALHHVDGRRHCDWQTAGVAGAEGGADTAADAPNVVRFPSAREVPQSPAAAASR